jgi:two-component system OmpR family sensor kinase
MLGAWSRLGLRGRLALSIAAIVLIAFGAVFVAVRSEMSDESGVIRQEEARESAQGFETLQAHPLSPVSDAQAEVERTFFLAGGIALLAALLAGYLLAARTAAPLRRMASTAARVDAGDLTPRIGQEPKAAIEVRILAEAFDGMLDRLDQAFLLQRRFASDASHELRTPLTAIRGQLEVLGRDPRPRPEEVRRVEEIVNAEMSRIERLVEDLLALARLDEGVPLRRADIALGPFLRRIADESGDLVEVGGLAAGTLSADPDRITQVIRNLLDNARRHAGPEGRVALSARAEGSRVAIRVDDDGAGIAAAERERVFERFHRSDAARHRDAGGSGLGLAIARSLVELHGGRIWAEDAPLGGARVAFELDRFEPQLGSA